jgi:hypothetical protein
VLAGAFNLRKKYDLKAVRTEIIARGHKQGLTHEEIVAQLDYSEALRFDPLLEKWGVGSFSEAKDDPDLWPNLKTIISKARPK